MLKKIMNWLKGKASEPYVIRGTYRRNDFMTARRHGRKFRRILKTTFPVKHTPHGEYGCRQGRQKCSVSHFLPKWIAPHRSHV